MKIHRHYPRKIYRYTECEKNLMENRNNNIEMIKIEIGKLKYWKDYIVFEGERYGIHRIFEDIHRENDCFGNIIFYNTCDGCPEHVIL